MKYQAFICCDPADRDLAADVRAALNEAGLSCVGYEDLQAGENYHKSLVTAIGESKTLIFIPPKGYGADSTVHSEVETAVKLKRTVIPYYRGEAELDDSLRFLTQNYTPIRADEDEDSLNKVVEAVRSAPEPPKPPKKMTRFLVIAGIVVLVIAGALLFALLRRDPGPTATGQDGENTWSYYEGSGKLVISGEGSGLDYTFILGVQDGETAPWYDYRESIKTVVVEDGVKNVGIGACYDMPVLESVSLPGTMTMLSTQVIYQCPKITEITIPEGVELISYGAITNCESFEKITLPASVRVISGAPCNMCPALSEIEISKDNANYTVSDGVLYSADMTELIMYPAGNGAVSYTMPDSVTTIMPCALIDCRDLKQIDFSANLRTIEVFGVSYAGITEAILPDGVTVLDVSAFAGCEQLSRVQLPEGLTQIGVYAFFGCPALKEITIPASVTDVGMIAFGFGENEDQDIIIYDITISGKAGSAAEAYCDQYQIAFKAID